MATSRWPLAAALAGTLALLFGHAWAYLFLCDDAFISFRYARNLSEGHGLVFNPGFERVEGYTNFLWVLVLAGFHAAGISPEAVAHVLTFAATGILWALVVWFALRSAPPRSSESLVLVPAFYLAITRSVAVWSSSGLETRWFEVLIVGAALRLVLEVEAQLREAPLRPIAPWLFAFGTLTRPDGLLVSVAALGVAAFYLYRRRSLGGRALLTYVLPYLVLVAGHFLFRRVYYGDWLPNTYYAKVGESLRWSSGFEYLSAFCLEYGAYLWVPALIAAVVFHRERDTLFTPLLFAAVAVPHALYVVAIGGDHFEYRPFDLYFPLAFLLLRDGAARLARSRVGTIPVVIYLAMISIGLWQLPYQSHAQFPDRYSPAFPGNASDDEEAATYLAPERDTLYRLPGLRWVAGRHRRQIRSLTSRFVAVRQEEHRLFLSDVIPEGRRLRALVETAVLPADTHIAVASVGAIPYYSGLRTLDILGLTDRHVAHSPIVRGDLMAHGKSATLEYLRRRGVDLSAASGVDLLHHVTSPFLLRAVRGAARSPAPIFAAKVGGDHHLVAVLPQGIRETSRRFPKLKFRALRDSQFLEDFREHAITAYRAASDRGIDSYKNRRNLAFLLLTKDDFASALSIYQDLLLLTPQDPLLWMNAARCQKGLGDHEAARRSMDHALSLARSRGKERLASWLQRILQAYDFDQRRSATPSKTE